MFCLPSFVDVFVPSTPHCPLLLLLQLVPGVKVLARFGSDKIKMNGNFFVACRCRYYRITPYIFARTHHVVGSPSLAGALCVTLYGLRSVALISPCSSSCPPIGFPARFSARALSYRRSWKFGTALVSEEELLRAEFVGEERVSPVTGEKER